MGPLELLRTVQRFDRGRASIPGEHWGALAAGASLLKWSRGARSPWLRLAGLAVGAAMIYRAASGRDGPLARMSRRAEGPAEQRSAMTRDPYLPT